MATRAGSLSPVQRSIDHVDDLLARYSSTASTGQTRQTGSRGQSLHGTQMSPHRDTHSSTHSNHHLLQPTASANARPPHAHKQRWSSGTTGSVLATSWSAIPTAINGGSPDPINDTSNCPTAAEIIELLREKVAILSGGRDRLGQSVITFPAQAKTYEYNRDSIRKVIQYLACIPTEDVREYGFNVIIDGRTAGWQSIKTILRTLQEALPGQINVVYTIQPGQFWQKKQNSRGHSKEKGKLEFSTVKLSSVDKLIRHVESSQLTSDLGGFLPYNHDHWLKLRLDLEHFISSFNALMEHTAHVEQQLTADQEPSSVEIAEECLARLVQMQEQLRKAPQNTIREGNELLRALEQGRDEAGTSGMTPDKINAQSIIRKLLDKIGQRQMQLDDLWRERKVVLEQSLQLRVFEKSTLRVRFWLKSRAEDQLSSRCDIGAVVEEAQGLLEQHEKFEAKTMHQHNALTQLRRMADRFSGDQLESADTLQRQVAKLTSRFSKFESNLEERRKILLASVRLHTSMKQWCTLCEVTVDLLKQDVSSSDSGMSSDELLSNHNDHLAQLWQVADTVLSEATSLIELMKGATRKLSIPESGKRAGNGYTPGMDHVSQLIEDVENHRKRLGQLAEARKLQTEELKRLHSCEKDAKQVTQWLGDMLNQQILPGHGDIGDSVSAVKRLISDHKKFTDNAMKTYKYGCDLVSAAQRTRKSCRLDPHPSSTLLSTLDTTWEQLSEAVDEVKGHLEMAMDFHNLSEEALSSYLEWNRPIHQLPKTPQLIEDKIKDMTHNKDRLVANMKRAIDIGNTLLDRLMQPLTSDPKFQSMNESTKHSLSFLRGKLEDLQRSCSEVDSSLPQQVELLKDFLTYCQFEQNIEKVLLWLQEHGLKQMHAFSRIEEDQSSVRAQMKSFDEFLSQCQDHTPQVTQLYTEAAEVDSRIDRFKSDLVKKTTSLKAVWDKFSKRVDDRHAMLLLATHFYDNIEEFNTLCQELQSSLSVHSIPHQDSKSYLNSLQPRLEQVGVVYQEVSSQGEELIARFRQPPLDLGDPAKKLSSRMDELRTRKSHIDKLWSGAWKAIKSPSRTNKSEVKGQATHPVEAEGNNLPGKVRKKSEVKGEAEGKDLPGKIRKKSSVKHPPPEHTPQEKPMASTAPASKKGVWDDTPSPAHKTAVTTTTTRPPPLSNGSVTNGQLSKQTEAVTMPTVQSDIVSRKVKSKVIPKEQVSVARVSKKYTNQYGELEEEAYKYLEELETKCDNFLSNHTHFRDSPDGAKLVSSEYKEFMLTLDPITTKLEDVVSDLMGLCPKVPPLATSITQLCVSVRERVAGHHATLTQRSNVLVLYDEFCELYKEVDSDLCTLDEFLCQPSDGSVTMEMLGNHKVVMNKLNESYPRIHTLGTQFLELTSEILTARVGPKLEVGGACTSVAVDLGDVEGRYPDVVERWKIREVELSQQMDWQAFKSNYDQISTWLKESAGMFLATRIDVGSSLETAEDLLMELGEFEIRAKRTASEVQSLLVQTESMLSSGVHESSELSNLAWDLRTLHDDFNKQLSARGSSLKDAVSFFMNAEQLKTDMQNAVETCNSLMLQDLRTNLKITSISTRLTNLQHEGTKLLEGLGLQPPTPDHTHKKKGKSRARRTESLSASELAIKQILAKLQRIFNDYKKAVERRRVSPSPQPLTSPPSVKSPSPGQVAIIRRKSDLKSPPPKYQKTSSPKRVSKQTSLDVKPLNELSTPVIRIRANTGEETKKEKRISAVLQRVVTLNQQSTREDAHALRELGTTFGHRPRSRTADPVIRSPDLPHKKVSPVHHSKQVNGVSVSPCEPSGQSVSKDSSDLAVSAPASELSTSVKAPTSKSMSESLESSTGVVLRKRSQTAAESVPLRKRGGGLSRVERREKINAIRQIFELNSLASALSSTTTESKRTSRDKSKMETSEGEANLTDSFSTKRESVDSNTPVTAQSYPEQSLVSTDIKDTAPANPEQVSASTDLKDTAQSTPSEQDKEVFEDPRPLSPTVLVSPPPEFRPRLQTAPTVYRAVLKEHRPAKQRVIPINMEPVQPITPPLVKVEPSDEQSVLPDSTEPSVASPTHLNSDLSSSRRIRATRSASPQAMYRIQTTPTHKSGMSSQESSPIRRASRRPPPLRVSGKVSSLRDMFDSQASTQTSSTGPIPRFRSRSVSSRPSGMELTHKAPPNHRHSASFELQSTLLEASTEVDSSAPDKMDRRMKGDKPSPPDEVKVQTDPPRQTSTLQKDAVDAPDIEPCVDEGSKVDSVTTPTLDDVPLPLNEAPVPRPPSPVGRILDEVSDSGSETSEFEFDLSSDEFETSSSGSDDVDGMWEEPDSANERMKKSMSAVLSELVQTEQTYTRSVEVLATAYLPLFDDRHVPTYLQGRRGTIFSNILEIHEFQRQFSADLCHPGGSVEDICNTFISNGTAIKCYVPFLCNMTRGLRILTEYGGSFFQDRQRDIGDEESVSSHYCRVKERLVEYDHFLRELVMCSQKEALYAVNTVKEALNTIQSLLRDIDNAIAVNALRGCPHPLTLDHMIRRDVFQAYSTRGKKKKLKEYHVLLSDNHIIFTRARKEDKDGPVHYEVTESLKVAEMHLLETYKSRADTFAVCEGKLSPDNLHVLTPVASPLLMKAVWLQEIRPLLQKKHSRRNTVGEEDAPLPYCFQGSEMPRPQPLIAAALVEREGWFGSLRRGKSFRGSMKRTGSLRRRKRDKETRTGRRGQDTKVDQQEDRISRHSQLSGVSQLSGISGDVPPPALANIQLASLSRGGQFLPAQNDDIYVVVESYSSKREGLLTVEKGQLVEVLDNSSQMWMVLTIAQRQGELEMEGFLPASCLRPANQADVRQASMTIDTSHTSQSNLLSQLHDRSHDTIGAEPEQVLPHKDMGGAEGNQATPTVEDSVHITTEPSFYDLQGTAPSHSNVQGTTPSRSDLQGQGTTPSPSDLQGTTPSPSDLQGTAHSHSERSTPSESTPTDMYHHGDEGQLESPSHTPDSTLKRKLKPPDLDLTSATPTEALPDDLVQFNDDRPSIGSRQFERVMSYHEAGPNTYLSPMSVGRKLGDYSTPAGAVLTSSLRSLPTTFSPVTTPLSTHKYLGYDPMQISEVTLSYPELGPPAPPTVKRRGAREEMKKLRLATVQNRDDTTPGSVDDYDPVEVYFAIADFEAAEDCNISLTAGQCVEVLDGSRSDWWLVVSTESGREGWVPACYLEKQTLTDPSSPPPEPFEDETGELKRLMMKGRSPSDICLNRRELYKSSFLAHRGETLPEEPSEAQLQGMFSITHPYVAMTEVQAEAPGQLSLVQEQPVTVVDSKRDDWWLVRTIPDEDASPPVEGWVHMSKLRPDDNIREDSIAESTSLATITSAFEEAGVSSVTLESGVTRPQRVSRRVYSGVSTTGSPGCIPLWMVLADYKATESGMLSVHSGDLVEVMDISRNEWCLVRPSSSQSMEGWVPMGYLKPYNVQGYANPSLLPPRFHQHSSSSDESSSDVPPDYSDRSAVTFSPEGILEAASEDARTEAKERRRFVVSELAKTERDYVDKLEYCLEHYYPLSDESSAQRPSQDVQDALFGNLVEIYSFHKNHFLPELTACQIDPMKLGDTFVTFEEQLRMYVTYCKNKETSDNIYHEYAAYFDERRSNLRDRLELPDYLILPVQRITKYTLLLRDFHKYSVRAGLEAGSILSALEVSRGVSTLANNAIHLSLLDERVSRVDLGELVMQELFGSQEGQKQLYKERRIFLFQKALIITKRRRENSDKENYIVKEQLMLSDISMTQDMDPNRLNIITYDMLTGTKFILRAPKTSVRDKWLAKANELIRLAKKEAADSLNTRNRSSSEPNEYLSRTSSFSRKSMFKRDREGSKRRSVKRPHSSTGIRGASSSPEEQVPPGTEYVVMECIVMEGGDDVTLDPGEAVKLVRAEPGGGVLRVKTMDDPPIEGKIPSSYLRKKDSVKGLKMEAIPKFTMTPTDMDLIADSTATISCAFNGYPIPSIIWRKDHIILSEDEGERWRITSCATSSVLEVTRLDYDDVGTYSCYITNSMGSDSADMVLSIHGPPGEPVALTASKITSTSVKLKWSPPDNDGESPIHSYQVEMLQEGFDTWQPIIQQSRNHFMVKSLLPNTTYLFRVIAYNEYGASEPSQSTKVIMGAKGRGWLSSQSFRRGNVPQVTVDSTGNSIDGPFDELGPEDNTLLSPRQQHIRRGSLSSMFDVMPEELGRGRFGIVHRCVHKQSGVELAAKYVRLKSKRKAIIRREVDILQKIKGKSPSLIEFRDAFERGRNLIIVTELIPDGELIERIIADNDLTEGVAVGYLSQLLSAVECLHQLSIAHLDIRPENILLSGNTLKLIDFGSACEMTSDLSPVYTSSVEFCAPEIMNQDLPSLCSDLWSVGVLTYVLLSGISPFFADNIQAIVERIKEARYSFYHSQFDQVSQEAKDFMSALLQKSPEYRMSATTALQHPWIKTLGRMGSRERATSPWPMARLDISGLKSFNARRKWHTMSVAIDDTTVFGPRSMICLSPVPPDFEEMAKHESPPHLWDGPSEMQVRVGSKVTIQYQVAGNPEPTVIWEHEDAELQSSRHHVIKTSGGVTSVSVTDVKREDEGVYACTALNGLGFVAQECQVTVLDVPGSPTEVNAVILGTYNSAMVSWLPPVDTGNRPITVYILQKRQLQFECWENVASVNDSTAHVVEDLVPGVTYLFRVSAVNEVGVGAASKPSGSVAIVREREYDSDSPCPDEVRLKLSSFEIEYERGEEIWKGNFTTVIQCRERTTDRLYAAKFISTVSSSEQKERALAEFEMHSTLSHPRIVSLEDAFQSDETTILVMEYLSGGMLQDLIASQEVLDEQIAARYTHKISEGLQYLHEAKIILVNLSPDNIILTDSHNDLKICDFSLARFIESGNQMSELEGRVEFMSPEVVALQPLTTAADIWSIGTITYLMLTGHSPFSGPDQDTIVTNISSLHLDTKSSHYTSLSHDAQDFIQYRVLVRNPRRRLTAVQCQRHRWLQSRSSRRSSVDQTADVSGRRLSLDIGRGSEDMPHPHPRRYSTDNHITSK